jgi:hypothetical protein
VPTVLHNLPFFDEPTTATVLGSPVHIRRDQIILWVSVERTGRAFLPPNAARFPAILDTGNSFNFAMAEHQLAQWTGLHVESFPRLGRIRVSGQEVPLLAANVWIHRNRPGQRDQFLDRPPFCIELDAGIAVYPHGTPGAPRLPLLGLRALRRASLLLAVDCRKCRVHLRTPRRFWLFG